MPEKPEKLPLHGVRVIDLATFIAGPFTAAILSEFGAEVIKVEQPGLGDPLRKFGTPSKRGDGYTWLSEQRNKKSVTLDPAPARGRGALQAPRRRGRHPLREFPARHHGEVGPGAG